MRNLFAPLLLVVLMLASALPPRLHAEFAASSTTVGINALGVVDDAHPCPEHDGAAQPAGHHDARHAGANACLLACTVLPAFEQPQPEPIAVSGVKLAIPPVPERHGRYALPPERPPRDAA